MDSLYQLLSDNLDQLVKVYRSLLDVVRREKEILVAAQIDELNENNKTKDAILVRLRSLENTRMKCARDLAQQVGADYEAPRLLEIATRMTSEKGDHLRTMHSTLELIIKRVTEINKGNEQLAQTALNSMSGAIGSIRETLQTKPTYARKGALVPGKGGGSIVSKDV